MRPVLEGLHAYQRTEMGMTGELLGRQSVGLQARFLTGNFTDPLLLTRKQLHGIHKNGAEGIEQNVVHLYRDASLKQRREYQQKTNLTLDQWKGRFDSYLQSIRDDTEHADRKEFLKTIGISDTTTAEDFYAEYLQNGSQVVKFVGDIEAAASTEQIEKHADIIRAIGDTFGYATSALIEHLIHGVRNTRAHIDEFVEIASGAANVPRTLNDSLLRIINVDSEKPIIHDKAPRQGTHGLLQMRVTEQETPELVDKRPLVDEADLDGEQRSAEAESQSAQRSPRHLRETATPVERVVFEESDVERDDLVRSGGGPLVTAESEEALSFAPLATPTVSPPQFPPHPLSPAPQDEVEEEEDPDPLTEEEMTLAMRYLSYSDINPPPYQRPSDLLARSALAKQYIREFVAMTKEYGRVTVLEAAIDAAEFVGELLDSVELAQSPASRSPSWYLWNAAMSRFLADNPDIASTLQYAERYAPFDPYLHLKTGITQEQITRSRQANDEILDRMFGWEIYRQRDESGKVFRHLKPGMIIEQDRLEELLHTPPKEDGTNTLSSYLLIEIGRIVRENLSER